tara:strand:- start:394 stop:960 length:567 start_codon:yes stop_codon:yes gene_type:complete
MKPVPGWSLTQPPGKWPWEQPPRSVDPDDVVENLITRMQEPRVEENYVKMMFAGVSVEEIVHSLSVAGFMNGEFSPDVAEIIKAPIGIYLMGLATDYNVPVKVFADEMAIRQEQEGIDDGTLLEIMRRRNPEFADFVENEFENPEALRQAELQEKMSQGFMAVEPDPEMMMLEEQMEMPVDDEMGEEE